MNTYELTSAFAQLSDMFESGELEEDVYSDTLESLPVEEAAEQLVKMRRNYEGNIEAISEEIKRLQEKKARLNDAKERTTATLLQLCRIRGGNIKTPLFTVSPRRSTAVVIKDEALIDDIFKERVETVKIDKKSIKEMLQNGIEVDGAELERTESVTIR